MTNPARQLTTRQDIAQAIREAPAGQLPPDVREALDTRKMLGNAAAEMAKISWGEKLDGDTRVAVARYAHRQGMIEGEYLVLGGKFYKTAEYYINRAAPFIRSGKIGYLVADHIEKDARLEALAGSKNAETAEKARREVERRAWERIAYKVPEDAQVAIVARCGVVQGSRVVEFTGCKFNVKGRRRTIKRKDGGSFDVDADPVGDEFPNETIETRAFRRVLRLVAPQVPELAAIVQRAEDDAVEVNEIIAAARTRHRLAPEKELRALPPGGNPLTTAGHYGNEYEISGAHDDQGGGSDGNSGGGDSLVDPGVAPDPVVAAAEHAKSKAEPKKKGETVPRNQAFRDGQPIDDNELGF